jgi:hypothetical protein
MVSPIPPSAFKALEINPGTDNLCDRLRKNVRFWLLFYKWYRYVFTADGDFTSEFIEELCSASIDITLPNLIMRTPVTPSQFKELIPSASGNFCKKFVDSLTLPNTFYTFYGWAYNEDGSFSDNFKAMICALSCRQGDGNTGGMTAPIVSASDGAFTDRVQVTWNVVSGANTYDVYRSTTADSGTAAVIAADLTTQEYFDLTVTQGTYYYYWVKAKNATGSSAFSNADRGYSGAPSTTLPAITDLLVGKGLGGSWGTTIPLVWTPVVGADAYDIYRNNVDNFSSATLIDANRTPYHHEETTTYGAQPYFTDENGLVIYQHDPGNPIVNYNTKYYFWVVAKRNGPAAVSQPSNNGVGTIGWAVADGGASNSWTGGTLDSSFSTPAVPVGCSRMHFALFGGGAGGAGGNGTFGAGGGGSSGTLVGELAVVAGAKLRIVSTPEANVADSVASADGSVGTTLLLQYSANGTFSDAVTVASTALAGKGHWNPAGGGLGGAAGVMTNVLLTNAVIYPGQAGETAALNKGGRMGNAFGKVRLPSGYPGTNGNGGSGAKANPTVPSLAVGKGCLRGRAHYQFLFY